MNKIDIIKALLSDDKTESTCSDLGTKKQIVVLNRGWVVVGDYSENGETCLLENASVIRRWGTTKGLGELAENGVLEDTVLDPSPDIRFNKLTMVARMDVNMKAWL